MSDAAAIAAVVYPHQLWSDHPALAGVRRVFLVEETLFFRQYRFHHQKLVLHRASMQEFAQQLSARRFEVETLPSARLPDSEALGPLLVERGVREVRVVDPCDDWLEQKLTATCREHALSLTWLSDPEFLTPLAEIEEFCRNRRRYFFTDFYIRQRKRLRILLEDDGSPTGGKWSFDPDNRKKLPKHLPIPAAPAVASSARLREVVQSIRDEFPESPGLSSDFRYPVTREQALQWLHQFVEQRLAGFGDYEDAMHTDETFLFHAVLTPALNIGLLTPYDVVQAALERADRVPLNSLEGFVRQVIGWREFIRAIYLKRGRRQRSRNFWDCQHPLPAGFYTGDTGIAPADLVIRRVLKHAYCHHIERLMVLGNFMLLCEIHPDAVYRWFMELFIDAYDWVMVPNVYGMSQHADGGLMTTKPYISGSSYLLKMSNFARGDWCPIWDALYWRFIHKHQDFFAGNPRMAMMARQWDRLGTARQQKHLHMAETYLEWLHTGSCKTRAPADD